MIQNKQDMRFYITKDMERNLGYSKFTAKRWLLHKYRLFIKTNADMAYNYLNSLRKLEYAENCLKDKSIFGSFLYRYRVIKFARLSYKYNISIQTNTIGYGLYLPHLVGGGIVINCKSMGNNCAINGGVLLGNKHTQDEIPTIGDNVDMTTGCKIIGKVIIGDNVTIAPNSVVVKDVPDSAIVTGIPAKILKIKQK